jgi:release factor glutamine methyltransferase
MSSRYLVKDILKQITAKLNAAQIPRASREAQLIFMHALDVDELWLLTNQSLHVENSAKIFEMADRRAKNEPLEYITNKVSFYSNEFYIDEGALIPRPETELLIDEVLKRVDKYTKQTFVEVGVGSGIISIMLALHLPNAKFIAVDISEKALGVARKNIEKFSLEDKIELRLGSLLEPIDEKVDYLVSNPPYIANDAKLESNLSYEPQNALFGGKIGDEIVKQLLDEVLKREINFFSCEYGHDQKGKISSYLQDKQFTSLEFYKDLSGFDRGFTLGL